MQTKNFRKIPKTTKTKDFLNDKNSFMFRQSNSKSSLSKYMLRKNLSQDKYYENKKVIKFLRFFSTIKKLQ